MVNVVPREDYIWSMATRDLALATHLTMQQAFDIVYMLEKTDIHPFDALPKLIALVKCIKPTNDRDASSRFGNALRDLIELKGLK